MSLAYRTRATLDTIREVATLPRYAVVLAEETTAGPGAHRTFHVRGTDPDDALWRAYVRAQHAGITAASVPVSLVGGGYAIRPAAEGVTPNPGCETCHGTGTSDDGDSGPILCQGTACVAYAVNLLWH